MSAPPEPRTPISVELLASRGMNEFLASQNISIAFTTYEAGNLFLFGPGAEGQLRVKPVIVPRPMGLAVWEDGFYVGGLHQIYRFSNVLPHGTRHEGSDRLYVPHVSWVTGEMDCHELAVEKTGRVIFVNTLYGCLATVSDHASFTPIWKPPCVTEMAPEDRCHLNGLALRDGTLRYATTFSKTDEKTGWRANKKETGVVWDTTTGAPVAEGLTMPHSPRWAHGKLWLLESGSGTFGYIDPSSGRLISLLRLPGYLRGLSFWGKYALLGSSIPRDKSDIQDADVLNRLKEADEKPYCGLFFVNIETGNLEHFVRIFGDVQELFDVAILKGTQAPDAIGPEDERIKYILKIGPHSL